MATLSTTDKVVIRTHKESTNDAGNTWTNTYEFAKLAGDFSIPELYTIANDIVNFERTMHYNTVAFKSVAVSTWIPSDSQRPYNPEAFLHVPFTNTNGLVPSPATSLMVDKDITLFLARQVEFGRGGKLFLRGAISESEIFTGTTAGRMTLDPGAFNGLATRLGNAIAAGNINDYFAGGENPIKMAMIHAASISGGGYIRPVINLSLQGIKINKSNHLWFNR